jgi:hypothetical protein
MLREELALWTLARGVTLVWFGICVMGRGVEMGMGKYIQSTMYTPYLLGNVVLVPFQAVIPPPQERRAMDVFSTQAVPKP